MISGFCRENKTALYLVIKQQIAVITYRRFGSTSQPHIRGSKMVKNAIRKDVVIFVRRLDQPAIKF
jgi:hypothetical protein